MNDRLNRSKSLLELQVFGVCTWMGEKLGMKATTIRGKKAAVRKDRGDHD